MKKKNCGWIFVLTLMGLILVLTNSCKKDNNNSVTPGNGNGRIVIKGQISKATSMAGNQLKSGNTLTLADARKVLVFSKYYYSLTDIVNGSFSVSGQIGTGVALIFLDANNKYIGNLSSQGLNMLPLGNLKNGENTQIDLSTLTLVGNSVIPSHDPLGNEIIISAAVINSLKSISTYYQSIAKNIDADNDGIPDVISNKQLVVSSIFARYSGQWGHNDVVPVLTDDLNSYINYSLAIQGGSALTFSNGNITLSGPAGSPYSDITTWGSMQNPGDNLGFLSTYCRQTNAPAGAPWGTSFLPFKQGTYTLTLDGSRSFTLDYSNIDAKNNLVIIAPTLHTNSDGKLTSMTFKYTLPDRTIIDPASMLTNVMVQCTDNQAHQFYNSSKLTSDKGFTVLNLDTPLDITALNGIDVWYDDLLGNQYDIIWRLSTPGNGNGNGGIVIKGQISKSTSMASNQLKSGNTLTLADAKKVLVFSEYYYSLTDIVNGNFSVTGQIGTGVALIFLGANNQYIGNLSSQGLNILPLGNLKNGKNTQIDLSTLTLVGNSVIPSHDPLGNEIIISAEVINRLKSIGNYYQSITKNIDADNDGIPDVISNKQLFVSSIFARYSGHWGHNDVAPVLTDDLNSYINYSLAIQGGSALTFSNGNIVLSGPADSPYSDITTWGSMQNPGGNMGFLSTYCRQTNAPIGAPWGTSFLPFKQGTYTVTLDGNKSFTLDYSNINVKNNLVIIAPTLHTNSDGKLTSITFKYTLPDGAIVDPASILTNVMVQCTDNQAHQFYNSSKLTSDKGFTVLNLDTPLDITALNGMDVWYDDLLGNQYDIIWR